MTGHALGAAGGIEAVFSVKSLSKRSCRRRSIIEFPDPDCDLDYIPNAARDAKVNISLEQLRLRRNKCCLIFKRFESKVVRLPSYAGK